MTVTRDTSGVEVGRDTPPSNWHAEDLSCRKILGDKEFQIDPRRASSSPNRACRSEMVHGQSAEILNGRQSPGEFVQRGVWGGEMKRILSSLFEPRRKE